VLRSRHAPAGGSIGHAANRTYQELKSRVRLWSKARNDPLDGVQGVGTLAPGWS
jgi:hypothetical protein